MALGMREIVGQKALTCSLCLDIQPLDSPSLLSILCEMTSKESCHARYCWCQLPMLIDWQRQGSHRSIQCL